MLSKQWQPAPPAPPDVLRSFRGMSPILAQVLYNRGLTDPQKAGAFLYSKELFAPLLGTKTPLHGLNKAVGRLNNAIRGKKLIVVYGDFDADGVTSTALLTQVLKRLGANVQHYIPHRVDEGYGLNNQALYMLKRERKADVVITVDCGIRSVDEAEYARTQLLLDLIITDHHNCGPELPEAAYAVINPKQPLCTYPEKMLAGVGIAYKVATALLETNKRGGQTVMDAEELLDLVAIGTVADLAPLDKPENRAMVRRGLQVLNQAKRPGIHALLEVSGVRPGEVSAMSIGFSLGPRINAAGRLAHAEQAYKLLSTNDVAEAEHYAQELQALNIKRQEITRAAQDKVREQLEKSGGFDSPVIIATDTEFTPGVIGLVAGRLTEEFFRPSIVIQMGEKESHASCRSIPQVDITHALDQCADLLIRHGGHRQAAGLTILNENLPAFEERVIECVRAQLGDKPPVRELSIDVEVDLPQLTEELIKEFQLLEPTGNENPSPVLMTSHLRVVESRSVGKNGAKHLKLKVTRDGGQVLDAIGFNMGDRASEAESGRIVDLAYQLEMNEWNGNRSVQMNIKDLRPAQH